MTINTPVRNTFRQRFPRPLQRVLRSSLLGLAVSVYACSGTETTPTSTGGSGGAVSTEGSLGPGGSQATAGGGVVQNAVGGARTTGTGATSAAPVGGNVSGGRPSSAGSPGAGGAGAGGTPESAKGGRTNGGAAPTGGTRASGGIPSNGGSSSLGTGASGSTGIGGSTATGGGPNCPLPTQFKWKSTGPLAKVPRTISGHNVIAIKDFTDVVSNGKHIVYATAYEGGWKSAMFTFTDWADWDATPGIWVSKNAVAPTLVYFTPKKTWVLTYQWGFQYATSDDPTDPTKWSAGKSLLSGGPSSAIDQTLICDDTNCYLFFAGDNGNVYRSSMPIGNFPGTFNGYKTILTDTQARLFEAVQVYKIKGANQYLMIVEAMGSGGRYFRAFTASSLDGTFTAMPGASSEATPFAGKNNVSFTGSAWSNDISHGDMVRTDPSETQTIDPCNLQFLYQGFDKTKTASDYGTIPYQPGLLTLSP